MLVVVVGGVVGVGGGGGLELRLSPCATEELDAVDVVSCALAVVSSGFNALAPDSILAATAPVTWPWVIHEQLFVVSCRGYMACPIQVANFLKSKRGE